MRYFLLFSLLLIPVTIFAQDKAFVPLTNIPALTEAGNASNLPLFLNNLYKICIGLAAVLAVLQLIRAGIMYMMGDSITEKKEAKNLIGLAVMGLVLVLSPTIVFGLINKDILELNLDVKVLNVDMRPVTAEPDPNNPLTKVNEQICGGYSEFKFGAAPENKTCSQEHGEGWAAVSCCQAQAGGGAGRCCGLDKNYKPNTNPGSFGQYSFIMYIADTGAAGDVCRLKDEKKYTEQFLCEENFQKNRGSLINSKTLYAVSKTCDQQTESGSPTTAAKWAELSKLPACSQ